LAGRSAHDYQFGTYNKRKSTQTVQAEQSRTEQSVSQKRQFSGHYQDWGVCRWRTVPESSTKATARAC
jgi:hypothetical protein